jgi:hypothetical protein
MTPSLAATSPPSGARPLGLVGLALLACLGSFIGVGLFDTGF